MKHLKKIIAIIIILCTFFTNIAYGWQLAEPTTKLPDGIPYKSKNNYRLNLDLFYNRKLQVYGAPDEMPGFNPAKDFKKGSNTTLANDNSGYKEDAGHFVRDGVKGEYRFYGFDVNGEFFTNPYFPVDEPMTQPPTYYNWIYRIWNSDKSQNPYYMYHAQYAVRNIGNWNDIAINGDLEYKGIIQNQINQMQPFRITNSNNSDKSFFNYAHIKSMPTVYTTGEVRMFHLATFKNGTKKVYYTDETVPTTNVKKGNADTTITATFDKNSLKMNVEEIKPGDPLKVKVILNGVFDDKALYDGKMNGDYTDAELRQLINNRENINCWYYTICDSITNKNQRFKLESDNTNTSYNFDITIPYDAYKNSIDINTKKVNISFKGWAEVVFDDKSSKIGDDTIGDKFTAPGPISEKVTPPIDVPEWEKPRYPIKVDIQAPYYMLDTEKFKLQENTDQTNVVKKIVELDGVVLTGVDEETFLNGEWLFPLLGKDEIYNYSITYFNQDGWVYSYKSYIKVYTTKPSTQVKVTGKQKENRALTAINDTNSVNSSYLLARSTMNPITFNVSGEEIYIDTENNNKIVFLSKKPLSDIDINLKIECIVDPEYIERSDIPFGYHLSNSYTYKLHVVPDYAPAVVCNIWNFVLLRNEMLQMTYEAVSTDGDVISTDTYKLYYDEDKDDICEKLIMSGNSLDFINYKPDKLGKYKLVFNISEEFGAGEPTISRFITAEDKKQTMVEREFFVDNLAPQTQIYVDASVNYPEVDLIILNDETITRELNNEIVSTNVSLMNDLVRQSLNPSVQNWDLHTYIYEQAASDIKQTGGSVPPMTVTYSNNGYSGTLNRYNYENNPYEKDCGGYVSVTRSKEVTASGTGWSKEVYKKGVVVSSTSSNNQTKSYNSGGYSGTLYQDSFWETGTSGSLDKDGNGTITTRYGASYSGTVSGTFREWEADWQWFDSYTGYYSGTIYKPVKQTFTPVYRDKSDKYLIYFADSYINNLTDIQAILNRADSKIILIGNDTVKNDSRIKKDLFIDKSKSLDEIYKEIIKFVADNNKNERGAVVLVNQEIKIEFADSDLEGDPIEASGFQIVHTPGYFDNSTGQESGTTNIFNEHGYNLTSLPLKYSKPGLYELYRRIKDNPMDFPTESEISNDAKISLYVHRKPIANCSLDWTFNNTNGTYKTNWVDKSYDPDLQYKDPEGTKGIRERKIKYRKVGTTDWIYEIPNNLPPSKYELEYLVKDNFGVWSDPFLMNFELPTVPPAQINAKLKTQLSVFSLNSVPASENLLAYDIWTRYPFDLKLQLALYNGLTLVSATKEITFSSSTGSKNGQDIYWNEILYNIPATLRSQAYIMKIRAIDVAVPTRYTDLNFNVMVKTPIDLQPIMNEKLAATRNIEIKATTSKYVNSSYSGSGVNVTLFDGTSYARTLTLSGTTTNWNVITNQPLSIPEGNYKARFIATLPSGETEVKILQYQYVHNTPPVINEDDVYVDINNNYIYENDDVNYILNFHDIDLTPLLVSVKLYNSTNTTNPIKEYNTTVSPIGGIYQPFKISLIENIPLGDYKIIATVTDDYNETATITTNFTAHDLWVNGSVTHTTDWEKNRQTYNTKYPGKVRDINTYWSGEAFETKASTTIINENSNVICNKVSVEIINKEKPFDKHYLKWLNADNITKDKWSLSYWDNEWVVNNGYVITKWGKDKKQELTLRFTSYYNNDWVETHDVKVFIDNQDDYWKLHRTW